MRIITIFLSALLLTGLLHADLLLGSVDRDKVKSFKNYFGRFYDVEKPIFEDPEFEKRVQSEAVEIFEWISDEANWPENLKKTPELQSDLSSLYYYLGNAGIQKAKDLSRGLKERAAEENPNDADLQIEMFWFYKRATPPAPEKYLIFAERALKADPAKAEKENLHYWIALEAYHQGMFQKAKTHIEEQYRVQADFEDTATKKMIFNLLVDQWGYTPENVKFEKDADGVFIPIPIQMNYKEEATDVRH